MYRSHESRKFENVLSIGLEESLKDLSFKTIIIIAIPFNSETKNQNISPPSSTNTNKHNFGVT